MQRKMRDIDTSSWKEFKISDICEQFRGKEASPNRVPDGDFNMINEISSNNGVAKKGFSTNIFQAPAITVSVNSAQNVFFQEEDFCASVNILILKADWMKTHPKAALYLTTMLRKNNVRYDYSYKISKDKLNDTVITLPVTEQGEIDWGYMEERIAELEKERIAELEKERIAELEQYLIATGLNDYELSAEDEAVLGALPVFKEFILNEIAHLEYGNKFDKNKMTRKTPVVNFVSRTAYNNGISDVVDMIDGVTPYQEGCITLAFGGSVGSCFLQEQPFYTGQNVGIITFPQEVSREAKLFVVSAIEKKCKLSFYAFGNEINKHFKTDLAIMLPVTEQGEIDWDFMERYIKAIEKVVIADVVRYKDEVIATAKMIVS